MRIDSKKPKNILVVRNDRFGEFLLNIPAFRALKETFINARLIAVVDPYVLDLAGDVSFIDEIIEWSGKAHPLREKLRLTRILKNKKIDIAVMLNPSKVFNIITCLAGIPVRVGYNRKCGFLLTHKMRDEKYKGEKHEVDYNLDLVGLIGAQTTDKTLTLKIDQALGGVYGLDDCVAIHPNTSDPVKQWPEKRFVQLCARLIGELGLKVAIVGGRDELEKSIRLFSHFASGLINLTGRTNLAQLATALKKCRLLISGDSGPMHLACAAGTPVIAIFRSDLPGKTAKRWGPWGSGHIIIEKTNLDDISVDEVFNKVKEKLNK